MTSKKRTTPVYAPRLVTPPPLLLTDVSASEWLGRISSELQCPIDEHRGRCVKTAQPQPRLLPAHVEGDIRNAVLYIEVIGPLDLRCIFRMQAIAGAVDQPLVASRIHLEGVTRIFDSGVAALVILLRVLAEKGIRWIYVDGIGSRPATRLDRLDQRLRLAALGQIGEGTGSTHGIGDSLIDMHG
jgi:hypothetical protein